MNRVIHGLGWAKPPTGDATMSVTHRYETPVTPVKGAGGWEDGFGSCACRHVTAALACINACVCVSEPCKDMVVLGHPDGTGCALRELGAAAGRPVCTEV